MKIDALFLENFMSVERAHISLADRGLVTVFGKNLDNPGASSNGSGKSAIWDGLSWGLYGKTFRGTGGDDICRTGSKGTHVSVDIIDGKDLWAIIRYRNHPRLKNALQLFCNDKDVSSLNTKETQEKIDALLGMDYQTFSTCVVFGQGTFRFAQATDAEQKAILDRILGMERYVKAYEVARSKKQAVADEITPLDNTIRVSEALIAQNDSLRNRLVTGRMMKLRELETAKASLEHSLKKTEADKEHLPAKVAYAEAALDRITNRRTELVSKTSNNFDQTITALSSEKYNLQSSIRKAEAAFDAALARSEKIAALKQSCMECGQTVGEAEAKRQLGEALREQTEAQSEMARIINPKRNLTIIDSELAECKFQKAQIQPLLVELEKVNRDVAKATLELKSARQELTNIDLTIMSLRKSVEAQSFDEETHQQCLKNLDEKDLEAKTLIDECQANKKELSDVLPALEFWVKGFGPGGIRSFILDSITPYLNQRIAYYAGLMFDGTVQITCSTQTELKSGEKREKFAIEVTNSFGAKMYEGNSAGERQRIDICIALALQDLARTRANKSIELVVFDEAFERLDEAGCERVVQILRKKSADWKSCFVVTHLDELQSRFDSAMTIVKSGGKSLIDKDLGLGTHGKKDREILGATPPKLESRASAKRV